MNSALGSGAALGGAAAGIAALAHASGTTTTLVAAAATGGTALFGSLQKNLPANAGQTQLSAVTTAGLQYLTWDEMLTRPPGDDGAPKFYHTDETNVMLGDMANYENSYAHLFDAAMSACTVASQ